MVANFSTASGKNAPLMVKAEMGKESLRLTPAEAFNLAKLMVSKGFTVKVESKLRTMAPFTSNLRTGYKA